MVDFFLPLEDFMVFSGKMKTVLKEETLRSVTAEETLSPCLKCNVSSAGVIPPVERGWYPRSIAIGCMFWGSLG